MAECGTPCGKAGTPWPLRAADPATPAYAVFDTENWPDTADIFHLLHERGSAERKLVGVAESCTGGLIASSITDFSGSSRWFYGGWIVYSNHAKHNFLGVNPYEIQEQGAVSEAVVRSLLAGVFEHSPCAWAMAVSGVAGPEGGSPAKPVGTVWLGAARRDGQALVRHFRFDGGRAEVRRDAAEAAALTLLELMQVREFGIDMCYKL
jgi:nicotinamide-nucleotide amidase